MIPFDQAKKLKNGDIVFEGNCKGFVIKTAVNDKTQTVAITFTDGSSDEFNGTNENLSVSQEVSEALAAAAYVPKKRKPMLTPLPKATDSPKDRIDAGSARNAEWSSLDWFENDRAAIAHALSSKLGIPLDEFADTPKTASFHFMTLALAVAKWLQASGREEIRMRDENQIYHFEELARSKAMAGILVRLFSHPFVQDIGKMERLGVMVKAFTQASGVPESMLGHVLTAHSYVRQSTLLMARHIADGSPNGSPITMDFFSTYYDFLENDPDGFMPSDAMIDASSQLFSTLKFLHDQASLRFSLDTLPEGEQQAHYFLRKYLNFAGMYRTPAILQLERLSFEEATLDDTLDSLVDEKPFVLIDTVFQDGDKPLQIIVPHYPTSNASDAKDLPMHLAREGKKLPVQHKISVTMYSRT